MLPEPYQSYAQPGPYPVRPAEVQLYDEADPIVHVPDPYDPNRSVQVRRSALQPLVRPEPRDLAPLPLIDPIAARMAGAGLGAGTAAAGIGWGFGQAAAGMATAGGSTAVVVMLALWLLARAGRSSVHVRQEVHNHNSWWGKSSTNL
ncbi:hypothetical protein [Streptomyces caniscabiei]|uniref:hypothetical protein n=1 Tax=Streptomyces caniscabiei TaxID=2746961 RepID=UPI001872705E|nr:hypothetical protein [Streptomyces caniscabiei]MBE4735721.1 hypothetical protein [Streptomyces caniscabiei]MBE4758334.1 hypothetical protein [Streptomyces caniscabiei]MBE4788428.1 hypothetical protein [Streptomyces caniscabiei]MDX2986560.1 hypothetical protein [Streptomyces caniscabiei]